MPTPQLTLCYFSRNHRLGSWLKFGPSARGELAALWNGLPFCRLGEVTGRTSENGDASPRLTVHGLSGSIAIDAEVARLKSAWQEPLRW